MDFYHFSNSFFEIIIEATSQVILKVILLLNVLLILFSTFQSVMAFWDSGSKDFQWEVNRVCENLKIAYRCVHSVLPDGNCFFHAIIWLMDRPGVRATLSRRSRKIVCPLALRKAVVRFVEWDETLHATEQFTVYKTAIEQREEWLTYLRRMKKDGEYAQDMIIWATALYIGKDIHQASDTSNDKAPWSTVSGSIEGTIFKATSPPLTVAYLSQRHYEPLQPVKQKDEASPSRNAQHSGKVSHQEEAEL